MLYVSKCSQGSPISPRVGSEEISENEMQGMRHEIPNVELTTNMGTMMGGLELRLLGNMKLPRGRLSRKSRMGSLIEGRFVYTRENKPISDGHTKTGACVEENRKLDSRFRVKCFQEFVKTNESAPTAQLQIVRLLLAVIGYRKWNFRAVDVSRAFLRSVASKRDTFAKLPDVVEKDNVSWKLLKPLYGLSTACKDWCETILDFIAQECGAKVTSLDKWVFFRTQQGSD